MSAAIVIRCDGTPDIRPTIPLGQCRAAYPAGALEPQEAREEAWEAGWKEYAGKDLCPSCARYVP